MYNLTTMERIQSVNTARIEWCCAEHGMTLGDLASEAGIANSSLEKVMAGEGALTFNQLRNIAEYFGRGVLFFLDPEPVDEDQVHTAAFRTLANQKPELTAKIKKFIERVERQRSVFLSLRDEQSNQDLPRFLAPDLPRNNTKLAAETVRDWLGLGISNNFETYRSAIESKGILVFRSNGYNGKWQIAKESPIIGFSLYDEECPVVVVKKQRWESQQSFTLMHELGHLLLHKISSIDDDADLQSRQGKESEANAFAGLLLVPDTFLEQINDAEQPSEVSLFDDWLRHERNRWGVSSEVILRRLHDTGRLSPQKYAAYREWRSTVPESQEGGGSRASRYREPRHIFGDAFVRAVLNALNARHLTLSKASSYLDGLRLNDLHRLEKNYADA